MPNLFILDLNKNNHNHFSHENLAPALTSLSEKVQKNSEETHGLIRAKVESTGENIPLLWYNNTFEFDFNLKFGKSKPEDAELILSKFEGHLFMISLELTLDDSDEIMSEFESGYFNLKFGHGEDRRIYKIKYWQTNSCLDLAMNEINEEANRRGKKSEKRVLH